MPGTRPAHLHVQVRVQQQRAVRVVPTGPGRCLHVQVTGPGRSLPVQQRPNSVPTASLQRPYNELTTG